MLLRNGPLPHEAHPGSFGSEVEAQPAGCLFPVTDRTHRRPLLALRTGHRARGLSVTGLRRREHFALDYARTHALPVAQVAFHGRLTRQVKVVGGYPLVREGGHVCFEKGESLSDKSVPSSKSGIPDTSPASGRGCG